MEGVSSLNKMGGCGSRKGFPSVSCLRQLVSELAVLTKPHPPTFPASSDENLKQIPTRVTAKLEYI